MTVSVGIHVPVFSAGPLPSGAEYSRFFREVEELGLDAVWFEDRVFHQTPLLDSVTMMTWAAACTSRITIGTGVMVLNVRNAVMVARMASTLQHLSGGRLALGISLGGQPAEYVAAGVPMERRTAVFSDSIRVLRGLLRGEPVHHEGARFQLDGATIRPAANVPLYIGGRAEGALRRAGRLGDGWQMGPFEDLEGFKAGWAIVREAASQAGRDPDSLTAGRLIEVCVDADPARARETLASFLRVYFATMDVDKHCIYGTPADVAARLRQYVDAGMTQFMLGVPNLDSSHLRLIAEEVAPVLRA
jgi:alkanesulfonate monooxygenase